MVVDRRLLSEAHNHQRLQPARPGFSLALRQLLAALLDLLLASLVMYLPLSHFTGMPFGDFLVLYVFAQLAGLISMVPGGIGVFEGSFIFLASSHYAAPHIIAALIIYRVVYYFMPLLLAGFMLAAYELRLQRIIRHPLVSAAIKVIEIRDTANLRCPVDAGRSRIAVLRRHSRPEGTPELAGVPYTLARDGALPSARQRCRRRPAAAFTGGVAAD